MMKLILLAAMMAPLIASADVQPTASADVYQSSVISELNRNADQLSAQDAERVQEIVSEIQIEGLDNWIKSAFGRDGQSALQFDSPAVNAKVASAFAVSMVLPRPLIPPPTE